MTKPTDGEVVISGRSTKNGLKKVLKSIGSCPQENMIFPKLSVFQQVKFFAMVRILELVTCQSYIQTLT